MILDTVSPSVAISNRWVIVSKIMQIGLDAVYGETYAVLGVYGLSADCMSCVGGRSVWGGLAMHHTLLGSLHTTHAWLCITT